MTSPAPNPAPPERGHALGREVISAARRRSMASLRLSWPTLAGFVALPAMFNAIEWLLRNHISTGWASVFDFWMRRLGIPGAVIERVSSATALQFPLPHLEVVAAQPSLVIWTMTTAATIVAGWVTFRLPDKYLPLRYFLWFCLFVQATAIVFFAFAPERFPHTLSSYIDNELETSVGLLWILPWGHALLYYVFDFPWSRKVWLTTMTLAFVAVAVPLQLMLHVYVMARFSMLMLPVLFFVFGPTLLILGCIGLYGWGMSWRRREIVTG